MWKKLKAVFAEVQPPHHFRLPMDGYECTDTYWQGGEEYSIFRHNLNKSELHVRTKTGEIIGMKIGRYTI
ncbi:hypothetical protein [Bacillus wiedmannii]|uniref:hypothetical protein n=1 Tax=Bacillus wiedmannii TaxID=1890302 RepID=UPI000BEF2173|nr:hypothetical protein [Bacillus wiedmannii]PEM08534.1 hypothetical protein CN610_19985 [Bacillus wiedmannii]